MTATCAWLDQAGGPFRLEHSALPTLGPDETLVRIEACALCRSDLHTARGRRIEPLPCILGHEIVGTVQASNAGWATGTRLTWNMAVSCRNCPACARGLSQKCETLVKYGHSTLPFSGGLASHVVLRRGTTAVPVPASVPLKLAALINCSVATAAAMVRVAAPSTNQSAAVFGGGGLGLMLTAQLISVGISVTVFDPDPAARDRALAFGAEASGDVAAEDAFDLCFECSGAAAACESSLAATRVGATVVWAGAAAPIGCVSVAPERVVRKLITLRGVHNYVDEDLYRAVSFLAASGDRFPLPLILGPTFTLSAVDEAFRHADALPGVRVMVIPG